MEVINEESSGCHYLFSVMHSLCQLMLREHPFNDVLPGKAHGFFRATCPEWHLQHPLLLLQPSHRRYPALARPPAGQPAQQVMVTGGMFSTQINLPTDSTVANLFQGATWVQVEVNGQLMTLRTPDYIQRIHSPFQDR